MESKTRSAWLCLMGIFFIPNGGIAGELDEPTCDSLTEWSRGIDPEDRWEPLPDNPKIWLPKAMTTGEFESLFGKGALQWNQADVRAAKGIWNGCIQQAKKSRNNDQRKLLSDSRRYLTSNLRNLARYQERQAAELEKAQKRAIQLAEREKAQDAARADRYRAAGERQAARENAQRARREQAARDSLDRAVSELVSAPANVDSLVALGLVRKLDVSDVGALKKLEDRFGAMPGNPANSGTYTLMRELRIRGDSGFRVVALPRINARFEQVKPVVLKALLEEFSQNPADVGRRQALARRYEKVMADLEGVLSEEERRSLADESRKKRREIVDSAVAEAKSEIDQVPPGAQGISEIDQIIKRTSARGLDIGQRQDLNDHAHTRQRALADQFLEDAIENKLPALPETLAGIESLNVISTQISRGIAQKANREVVQRYIAASEVRLAKIGRKALPEYRETLARLPEDKTGLKQAERELADKRGWVDMEEGVRVDYTAAAKARYDEIASAVERESAQQRKEAERERKRVIAAGGDPRLVGHEWIDLNKTMKLDFRDQETVFVTALGFKFAGTYKVSRDDVVVKGPHGQLVFTFDGQTLMGMGAVFRRR